MSVQDHSYLIIGGAPKAGTTSLYKYLADHPDVCASAIKETRFFLDAGYPLPCAKRFNGTNLKEYASFFKHCRDGGRLLRLEATPDYLYSKTALRIADLLPNARIVFILRNPVERMVSWYKYARQKGMIGKDMSFEDFITAQAGRPVTPDTPIHMRALDQCRYHKYLTPFQDAFRDRCLILDFEELKRAPRKMMTTLCSFAGIDSAFYDNYSFNAENVSRNIRNTRLMQVYASIRRRIAYAVYDKKELAELLKKINKPIKKLMLKNTEAATYIEVPPYLQELINNETLDVN